MISEIKIATRSSKLALWQSNWVKNQILQKYPDIEITLVPIKTEGDKILDVSLSKIGGKGLFTKEIENKLLDRTVDLAVHSLKDLPAQLPDGLIIAAYPERENPHDVLVSRKGNFKSFPKGAIVGTSSLRRSCQLKTLRPDLVYKDLRGNVDTRLKKLKAGEFDGIILAAAGLIRLGWKEEITEYLDLIPAVGQGALAVELRSNDKELHHMISFLNHPETSACVETERAFLFEMGAGCQVPLGCHARLQGDKMQINAFLSDPEGKKMIRRSQTVPQKEGVTTARTIAKDILNAGGRDILALLQLA